MKKVEELKDLGCSVRGRFYDLAWSKPVLRAPAVHGVSSIICPVLSFASNHSFTVYKGGNASKHPETLQNLQTKAAKGENLFRHLAFSSQTPREAQKKTAKKRFSRLGACLRLASTEKLVNLMKFR